MRTGCGGTEPGQEMPGLAEDLLQRLQTRAARVGVVGLGYVGLPLVRAIAGAGFATLGFDIDGAKVEALNGGRSYIRYIADRDIAALRASGRFEATTDLARAAEVDVMLICVPTPLSRHREPDLSFIEQTGRSLANHLRAGQLIILESTTYPGTTSEVLRPILERSGLRSGVDLYLAYSPEREDPGNPTYATAAISKVVGGEGPIASRLAVTFYDQFVSGTVPVSTPAVAEAVKLTENIFRAVNIALANELKVVFEAMGIDVWEVIEAAKTKPFGYMPFYPGPGLGGHCIPIDPFYLTWKAREYDITTRFIELAGEINTTMPRHVVERLARALDQRSARGLNGAEILIVGVAYKKNVDDTRESPALVIMQLLEERGARFEYHDPFVSVIPRSREYSRFADRRSIELTPERIAAFDAVLVITDHDEIDFPALVAAARLVVDTRNATRAVGLHDRHKVVHA